VFERMKKKGKNLTHTQVHVEQQWDKRLFPRHSISDPDRPAVVISDIAI